MTRRVRVLLLAGCGLIALLEAPGAGGSLVAGLAGPYARGAEPMPVATSGAQASLPVELAGVLAPLFATLVAGAATEELRVHRR